MTDDYGLPDNVRGQLSDDWFALVGRLVHVTALAEEKLLWLTSVVTDTEFIDVQQMPAGKALAVCRGGLPNVAFDDRSAVTAWVDSVGELRDYRHTIVHGLWPNESFGHRSPMTTKPKTPPSDGGRLIVENHTLEVLQQQVLFGAELVQDANNIVARAQKRDIR